MDFDWIKAFLKKLNKGRFGKNLFNFASEKTYLISLRKNLYKVSLGKIFVHFVADLIDNFERPKI